MSLEKWLLPKENIHYCAPDNITYSGVDLRFYISNERILLHNKQGLIFKKETIVAERLSDVITMAYREEGILMGKKGILQVQTKDKVMDFKGKPESIKTIWQNLQLYIKRT
jgi:hypothetical protein